MMARIVAGRPQALVGLVVMMALVATAGAFSKRTAGAVSATNAYENVEGGVLQMCSGDGMALTGFTRTGQCVDQDDDAGSHHVCINMQSAAGGNFCEVTNQPNWCDTQMSCTAGSSALCPVEHWCVCQWAFAAYLEKAGGCDQIQEVVCEATNMLAVTHYREQAEQQASIQRALECLESRCNIPAR